MIGRSIKSRRKTKLSVLAATAMLALTGCGALHPGAAAVVGSATITHDRVDDVAQGLCSVKLTGAAAQGQEAPALPTRPERTTALGVLLETELSRQFGEEEGVDANQQEVSQALAQSEQTIQQLPESQRDGFRAAVRGFVETTLILTEIGRRSLADQGQADVPDDQAIAEGQRLRADFVSTLDVEVDPRYGAFEDNALQPGGSALSVAASDSARAGAQPEPAAGFVSALPASQRCS